MLLRLRLNIRNRIAEHQHVMPVRTDLRFQVLYFSLQAQHFSFCSAPAFNLGCFEPHAGNSHGGIIICGAELPSRDTVHGARACPLARGGD